MIPEHRFIPYRTSPLPDAPWLVFAPHPDDETLGMGGTLLLARRRRLPVTLVVLTDGAGQGEVGGEDLVLAREGEAREAARRLGISRVHFWKEKDRDLCFSEELIKRVIKQVRKERPQSIFFPSPMEIHPDHKTTAALVWEGIRRCPEFSGTAMTYETGIQSPVNMLIDISSVTEEKFAIMDVYRSQMSLNNYKAVLKGLNTARTFTLPREVSHAEGFFACPGDFTIEPIRHLLSNYYPLISRKASDPLPLVSVIIRTKDRPRLLRQALESVADQTYPNIELVVINDGGQDVSFMADSVEKRVQRLRQVRLTKNVGRAGAANRGLETASGGYLIFLDDDDLFDPRHIAPLVECLQGNPSCKVAYAGARFESQTLKKIYNRPYDREELQRENYIPLHTVMFDRALLEKGCRFDERLSVFEDWDFLLQLSQYTRFYHVDQVSATYRDQGTSRVTGNVDRRITDPARAWIAKKWKSMGKSAPVKQNGSATLFAQVFIDTGSGFYEEQSLCQEISCQETSLAFDTSGFEGIKKIRLDPINTHAAIKIERIDFILENDVKKSVAFYRTNASYQHDGAFIFRTADPNIFIDADEVCRLRGIEIKLVYLCWGAETFKWISDKQAAGIATRNQKERQFIEHPRRREQKIGRQLEPTGEKKGEINRKSRPRVSVIIPAHNSENYIAKSIQSVLDQTYRDFEIVVTNDGSTDKTVEEVNQFRDSRIRLFHFEKNRGVAAATNHCVKHAVGEYIAVIDSDNVFLPEKLERQITFLDRNPDIAAVFSHAHIIDDDGELLSETGNFHDTIFIQPNRTRQQWLHYFFFHANCLCHPSAVLRKTCYDTVGYYDERLSQLLDLDLWIRLCLKYEIFVIPEKLLKFRIRTAQSNLSGITPKALARHHWQINRILDRFLKIHDLTEFLSIFPEATKFGENLDAELIPYYLARLAFEIPNSASKLWALNTLHELLDSPVAHKIKSVAGFEAIDLIRLTEEPIFKESGAFEEPSAGRAQDRGALGREVIGRETLGREKMKKWQDRRILQIQRTLSWRLTRPLRYIWNIFHLDRVQHTLLNLPARLSGKFESRDGIKLHCDRVSLTQFTFSVTGWALADTGIERISIMLDGVLLGDAAYGDERPDVQKVFPLVKQGDRSGFHFQTDIPDISRRERNRHAVVLHVFAKNGQHRKFRMTCMPEAAPKGYGQFQPSPEELARQRTAGFRYEPSISIITPVYNPPERFLENQIKSVLSQTYGKWELLLINDGGTMVHIHDLLESWRERDGRIHAVHLPQNRGISEATNEGIRLCRGEFLAFVDHDDELTPDALYEIVSLLNTHPEADLIYSDQDKISARGDLFEPFFKPDWSPEFFRGVMYVGHLLVARKAFVEQVGLFDKNFDCIQDYEFVLRLSEHTDKIYHIPKILYHWRKIKGSVADDTHAKGDLTILQKKAVEAHLRRVGLSGFVKKGDYPHRVRTYPKPKARYPRVSIIIPTKDQPDMLHGCLESLFSLTSYPNFDVIVVDNDTTDPRALKCIKSYPITRLPFRQTFNFSEANNLAVEKAAGDYIVFLNNDTEVITQDWLQNLLYHAEQPDIGAAGALLLYPDGSVQHAGVVLGFRGTADHLMRHYPGTSDGYFGTLHCAREVSAVTAACMMIYKPRFLEVGGFNTDYRMIYQDVDLCLKLRQRGYRLIHSPRAVLTHHESVSHKQTYDIHDRKLFLRQWRHIIEAGDPYYNPNFDVSRYSKSETGYTLSRVEFDQF